MDPRGGARDLSRDESIEGTVAAKRKESKEVAVCVRDEKSQVAKIAKHRAASKKYAFR